MILNASAEKGAPSDGGALHCSRFGLVRIEPHDRRNIDGRRKIVDHGVEHRLDALVLERRAADHGNERRLFLAYRLDGAPAQRLFDFRLGQFLTVQVLLEQRIVRFAHLFNQLLAEVLRLVLVFRRNLRHVVVGTHRLVFVGDGLHPDEINDTLEVILRPNRQLNGDRISLQLALDLRKRPFEVGAHAVHLVDETNAGDAILVGLPPDGLGLRLDTGDRVEHRDSAVEHAQRPLDFGREVDVSRRIDDVDSMVPPETGRRGRGNRDAAFLFLFHPVHDGRSFMDLTDLVRNSGVEQNPFCRGGFAGIDVRHDADVPRFVESDLPGHLLPQSAFSVLVANSRRWPLKLRMLARPQRYHR